jgi:hypothetical protein
VADSLVVGVLKEKELGEEFGVEAI